MFLNIRLPEDISYGAVGGPEFSTNIVDLQSGNEYRNINWNYPRHVFEIGYNVLNSYTASKLITFFYITKGKAHSFRFKDWFDFEIKNQRIPSIDGYRFQLIKTYIVDESLSYSRIITKPTKNTVVIKDKKEDVDYKVDYSSGVITFLNKIEEDIVVDFEFDIPVRFDNDYCDFAHDSFKTYSWKSIKLIEVRE